VIFFPVLMYHPLPREMKPIQGFFKLHFVRPASSRDREVEAPDDLFSFFFGLVSSSGIMVKTSISRVLSADSFFCVRNEEPLRDLKLSCASMGVTLVFL